MQTTQTNKHFSRCISLSVGVIVFNLNCGLVELPLDYEHLTLEIDVFHLIVFILVIYVHEFIHFFFGKKNQLFFAHKLKYRANVYHFGIVLLTHKHWKLRRKNKWGGRARAVSRYFEWSTRTNVAAFRQIMVIPKIQQLKWEKIQRATTHNQHIQHMNMQEKIVYTVNLSIA